MKLFIVESPAKCKKIKSFLGEDFIVEASYGHVRSIPSTHINVNETTFEPKYSIESKKSDTVKKLKSLAAKSSKIYLATDPDREGEAISWHIYDLLESSDRKKCVRVTFHEITKKAVLDAVKNPRDLDMSLIQAQKARQVLDRLIGYKISPSVWRGVSNGTSAGRVQSVALRLICDRQKEIDAFKSEDYWFIDALLLCEKGEFTARVITSEKDNKYKECPIEDLEKLKKSSYILEKIEKKVKTVNPYPPFDTTSMIGAVSSLFGWSASKAMQIAQHLYEQGLTSYLRTDSYNISKEAIDEVREYIQTMGSKYLPDKPHFYSKKSSAASQEAHECLRPVHPSDPCSQLEGDEKRLYDLIRARFLACQMTPMIADTVTYTIKASSGHVLLSHGQVVKFDGWFKVYPYSKVKDEVLPVAVEGEKLCLKSIESSKHSTQPPPRYNDGSLIKIMEDYGVGRPSTRAPILKALRDKGYVEKDGKAFIPSELGIRVCDFLIPHFDDFIMDYKFTSGLEEDLDLIADSKKGYLEVVKPVYDFMQKKLSQIKLVKKELILAGAKCPVCKQGDVVEKFSRFGKFFSCSRYPACKEILIKKDDGTFSIKEKKAKEYSEYTCPKCGGKMIVRDGKYGKFHGCANYPRCRAMRKEDGTPVENKGRRQWKKKK